MSLTFLFLLFSLHSLIDARNANCVFNDADGRVFNLHAAMAASDLERVVDREHPKEDQTILYEYDPCNPFDMDPETKGGEQFLLWRDVQFEINHYHPIGKDPRLDVNGSQYFLEMRASIDDVERRSIVDLVCNETQTKDPIFKFISGNEKDNLFRFKFEHKCVCPDACLEGLSAGSVLLLLLFVSFLVYFLFGFLYLRCCRGLAGADAVPHREFWASLPGLVKDGAVFVLTTCNDARGGKEISYNDV